MSQLSVTPNPSVPTTYFSPSGQAFPTAGYAPPPTLQNALGPNGNLLPQYGSTGTYQAPALQQISENMQPLQNLEQYGNLNNTQPTAQTQYLQGINQMQTQQGLGNAVQQQQGNNASTLAGIASGGGLSPEARERVLTQGSNALGANQQNLNMAGAQNNLGILAQGQQNQLNVAEQLPGQEVAAQSPLLQQQGLNLQQGEFNAGAAQQQSEFNAGQNMSALQNVNQNALTQYGIQTQQNMGQDAAASQVAAAQASKGSHICTEVSKTADFSEHDWKDLRLLKRYAIKESRELAHIYLGDGPQLVTAMKKAGYDFKLLEPVIRSFIQMMWENRWDKALEGYIKMTDDLWVEFLGYSPTEERKAS